MAGELILAPEAGEDIAEAYSWYEQQRVGLGEEFLSSVDARFQMILREPEMNSVIVENYRRCLLCRFPYAIYYEFVGATVTVYGVFHTSRDPHKWHNRLSQI